MSMTNYELYKVFYWASKTGSLTKAAKALYLTQPSVSYAIKQLEDHFSIKLFYRTPKGVALTEEGAVLFSYIEQSQVLITLAEEKMAALKNLTSGELRIGGSDSLFKHYMLTHLEEFHSEFPNIKLQLIHGTTPEIINHLKEGKIDLGVVRLPITDPQIEYRQGIQLQDCFVAGEAYKELKDVELSLEKLINYPLVLFSRNSRARMTINELFQEFGYELKPAFEVGSVDMLIQLARRGLGISYVAREFVSKELNEGALFELKLNVQLPPSQVGILNMRSVPLSSVAQQFVKRFDHNQVFVQAVPTDFTLS